MQQNNETKGVLRYCIWAVVEELPDGTIICPLVDNMGCEECYQLLEEHPEWFEKE